ncbi:arylesterase [Pedobacter agri]|uniref:arylesterase n=1 Tax=Pedobacter agri TaxID=454586 RepID=UPI00292E0A8B|nr:arylesterase [Pedobacter agri]
MGTIVFFGDSLTAGYGLRDPLTESLPARIRQILRSEGMEHQVINAGLSGDTSVSALKRLPEILKIDTDIFVLELGANDLLRGHPATLVSHNLHSIISAVKEKHPAAAILILGMKLPIWIPDERAPGYRRIYQDLATQNHCELVPYLLDGIEGRKHLNMYDGVHPLAEGYKIMANNVWPTLIRMITKIN